MAVDPISPIAPARVRVLVLPAGRIKRQRFMTFVDRLQHESIVRLGDISPDGHSEKTMFSPMAFPNGALIYHFSTVMPPPSSLALTPFELFREPMMVIGIADAKEYEGESGSGDGTEGGDGVGASTKGPLESVADHFREQYPKILVHQLLIMDCSADHGQDWIPEGAMCVPAQKASRSTTLKTIMCDISAKFLSELTTYATAVQALPSVQSPGMSGAASNLGRSGSISSIPDSPTSTARSPPLETLSRTISPSVSGDSRSSSPQVKPPTSFDDIASAAMAPNNLTRSVSRNERDGARNTSKDRMSMQAFSSSNAAEKARTKGKARVGIVTGNLYILSGRWSDAWRELVENTNKSRIAADYLWYAKGLESILVCMLLFVWTGYDFHIPAICYSGIERTSMLISNGIKDGLPSLGTQDPSAAKDSAHRFVKLLPDLVVLILGIYERSISLGGEILPSVAYSESVLRLAKLLALVQNADGQLETATISSMIRGRSSSLNQPRPNAGYTTGVSRHAIAEIVFRAYPPPSAGVPLADATKMLSGIASVLSMLGLERKKAIVVKELVASLVPALVQARKVGAAEIGIHPAASLSAAFDVPTNDQQGGLDVLLKEIHSVYGVKEISPVTEAAHKDSAVTTNSESNIESLIDATIDAATNSADTQSFGSLNLKIDILRACIDFCEALPDLPGIVHFAALLLRVAGPQGAVSPSRPGGRVQLATEEQLRLISNMSRTSNAASKIGLHDIQVRYWDDFLVRSAQWYETNDTDKLREHQKSELNNESHPKERTPFLYDPFAKQDKKTAEKILVAEEPAELILTLQNPYDFEIKVENLSLVTEGVELEVQHMPFILGPARLQTVPIALRAKGVGKLKIVGCSVKFVGCREQVFPIYQDAWASQPLDKIKDLGLHGFTDRAVHHSISSKDQSSTRPVPESISSTVIHAQPRVSVHSTSLSESAMMVLEGQKKTFQVTLRNNSRTTSVDFLHVSFEDSLTTSIRSALDTKDLSRAEMYELELQLSQDPIFTWARADKSSSEEIGPGEQGIFDITVMGRPGLGAAKVMFDYAYLGQPFSQLQGHAYTRQVMVPLDVTVNASIQLHRIDFNRFPIDFAWSNQHRQRSDDKSRPPSSRRSSSRPMEKSNSRFRSLLDRVGVNSASVNEEYCLVLLDLRNAWPNPLTVSIEVRDSLVSPSSSPSGSGEGEGNLVGEWKRAYTVHEVIHPGHIARLVLLLPKLQISDPHAPIPMLSQNQRQFVLNTDKVFSADVEMAIREQFWFREEVLKYIRGMWKEDGSMREGMIDMRAIRLSPRMIDMVRLQDVDLSMTITSCTSSKDTGEDRPLDDADSQDVDPMIRQLGRSHFQVPPEAFLTLQVKVTNRASIPIRGILRLQPSLASQTNADLALDIGRKLMVSGLLQQPLPTIAPLQSKTIEVGLCPVVNGEFEVHALVEELLIPEFVKIDTETEPDDGNGHEDFSVSGQGIKPKERRIWRAEEACRLVVSR